MRVLLTAAVVSLSVVLATVVHARAGEDDPASTLDALHDTAARADGDAYFALFDENAAFIGTDAGEYWPLQEFERYARQRFATGTGWVYRAAERQIEFSPSGDVAWFHELLESESYGTARGTGVLLKTEGGWKIAQYHLTFPIPNDLAKEITDKIKAHDAR